MLYYPWFDEQADLLGGYPTYEAHYRHVCDTVHTNDTKEDVDDIDVDENGPPEHLWDNIAPSTEENRLHSPEGSEQLTEVSQQDLQDTKTYYQNLDYMSDLRVLPISKKSQYRQYIRELNDQ